MKSEIASAIAQHLSQELKESELSEVGEHIIDDAAELIAGVALAVSQAKTASERAIWQSKAQVLEGAAMARLEAEKVHCSVHAYMALRGAIREAIRAYISLA